MCEEYKGWINRETWAVALHLSNDEGLYNYCTDLMAGPATFGRKCEDLREFVEDQVEAVFYDHKNADGWARMMASDVGSFYRVDWRAVGASFMEDES